MNILRKRFGDTYGYSLVANLITLGFFLFWLVTTVVSLVIVQSSPLVWVITLMVPLIAVWVVAENMRMRWLIKRALDSEEEVVVYE